ncbi:MAG: PQQ-binding-like beta-propeller repeat protein, partial [Thermoguttaceae bacterium]
MQQTVLNTTGISGVRFLFYLAYACAVTSATVCVLFTYFLLSNYFAPYSQERIDNMIAMQKRIESEVAAKTEAEKSKNAAEPPNAESGTNKGTGTDANAEETAAEAESSGQRPNLDAGTASTITAREVSPYPFLNLPSDNPELIKLRELLAANTQNDEIREQIRELDQQLRVEYFRRKEIARTGAPFLLFAALALVFSARIAAVLNRKLPVPQEKSKATQQKDTAAFMQYGLASVMFIGAVCAGISIGISFSQPSSLEKFLVAQASENPDSSHPGSGNTDSQNGISSTSGSPLLAGNGVTQSNSSGSGASPSDETVKGDANNANNVNSGNNLEALANYQEKFEKQWAAFRGHDGSGVTTCKNIPTKWDATTGEGILWKSPLSLPGRSSPIVWDDKIFLTGADEKERKIFCFSITDGKLLWELEVPELPSTGDTLKMGVNLNEDTGYAAPTPVADGERVYAIFPTGDILGVDFSGKLVWHKTLGVPDNIYGLAASLTLYKDNVIVQYDQGDGKKPDESKLIAFRGATGDIAWET